MSDLGSFGQEFENNIVIFEISPYRIYLNVKFHEIINMPIFGTKNAFLVYFWARILK